ncbi:MAG TPA: flagellin [Bryobacteraceae bacterium]|nr:flagellin [Bryobacteraceae bacterium]
MSFSINTNIASLQAQNYLRTNSIFQSKTINEVTSGLRIVNSGDDAAGLAVANGIRSDEAVLTQGLQNANNGLATLQTIDGGMSNISQLLDRARTLATESASGTFTGVRGQLDSEFQSVLTEINRQAQAIGMNSGGVFAKNLSVFIGGGRDTGGSETDAAAISNGSVAINLAQSAVDTQSLGLTSYQTAVPATAPVLATIIGGTLAGEVDFTISGAGYPAGVTIAAEGVNNASSLSDVVNNINAAITQSANTAGAANQAFAAAGIQAKLNSNGTGIIFTSANAAFSVAAGTNGAVAAENILGTADASPVFTEGTQQVSLDYATAMVAGDKQSLTLSAVDANGVLHTEVVNLSGATTQAAAITSINSQLQADVGGPLAGLVAVAGTVGATGTVNIAGTTKFNVFVGVEGQNGDGFQIGAAGLGGQGNNTTSATNGTGGALDVKTAADAETAVTALAKAVTSLGTAQAAVGKGENNFNYAINLANSQYTNEAAAESGIRDADLATEAANLTKAQILLQAGVAALAQANAAPQNILTLLKG